MDPLTQGTLGATLSQSGSRGTHAAAAGTYREYWNPDSRVELELGLVDD